MDCRKEFIAVYFENIEKAKNDPQMKEIFEKSDLAMTFVYLYLLVCSDEERKFYQVPFEKNR